MKRTALYKFVFGLLQQTAIPASPLHAIAWQAAKDAGWTLRSENDLQRKNVLAGQQSAETRAARAEIRRIFVKGALDTLKPQYRKNPYAEQSIDALEAAYAQQFSDHPELLEAQPFKANRDLLVDDLKKLRSRRPK